MLNIFGRATGQLTLGVLVGMSLSALIFQDADFTFGGLATFVVFVADALKAE